MTRWMDRAGLVLAALSLAAAAGLSCGGGDPKQDSGVAARDSGGSGDGAASTDGGQNGTQSAGQFCGTLPSGGPYCQSGLDCCDDNVCRAPDDCPGSSGYIPCTNGDSCPSSKICCDIPSMRFCTKPSACDDYGGQEIP